MTTTVEAEARPDEPRVASQLPDPVGYRLLIALPEVPEKTESGIYKPHEVQHHERVSSVVGFVLKVGPDAYKDPERFPNGPYCKKGDWVIFRAYTGTRIKVKGKEFRLLNDDSIEAVVEDPSGIVRV